MRARVLTIGDLTPPWCDLNPTWPLCPAPSAPAKPTPPYAPPVLPPPPPPPFDPFGWLKGAPVPWTPSPSVPGPSVPSLPGPAPVVEPPAVTPAASGFDFASLFTGERLPYVMLAGAAVFAFVLVARSK